MCGAVGLVLGVDLEPLAVIGRQADVFELKDRGRSLPADRSRAGSGARRLLPDSSVAWTTGPFTAAGRDLLDLGDLFAESKRHAQPAHVVLKRLGDLAVEKPEDLAPAFDQRHLHAQRGHHAGVFGADDAAADHDHRLGKLLEPEERVGAEHGILVKRHALGPGGPRPGRDDEDLGADPLGVVRAHDFEEVRRDELGLAPDQLDVVAVEMAADQVELVADDLLADEDQVGDRDVAA